jgi:hypothetical protein
MHTKSFLLKHSIAIGACVQKGFMHAYFGGYDIEGKCGYCYSTHALEGV